METAKKACIKCKTTRAVYLKRQMCDSCYQRWYRQQQGRSKQYSEKFILTHPAKIMYSRIKAKCNTKKLDFDLDEDWISSRLQDGKCEATGLPIEMPKAGGGVYRKRSPWVATVDRIDPKRGYTKDNSRVVVLMYNLAKSDQTDEDVERMASAVIRKK